MEENKNLQNEQENVSNEAPATEAAKGGFFANKRNLYIVIAAVAAVVIAAVVLIVTLGGNNNDNTDNGGDGTSDVGGNGDNGNGDVSGDNGNEGNPGEGNGDESNEFAYKNGIELLNKVWATIPDYDENGMELKYGINEENGEKTYYFYGGDMIVDEETWEPIVEKNQAGNVSLTEEMLYNLYYPMDMISNIDEAASLYSMMGNGIFTAAAFHVTSGSISDIATKIEDGVQSEMWMCFMPQRVMLIEAPGDYVILVYGQDFVGTFSNAILSTIEGSKVLIDNPIDR